MLFINLFIEADFEDCVKEFFHLCFLYFFFFENNEEIQNSFLIEYTFDDDVSFSITGMNKVCCFVAFANDDFPKQI